MNSHNHPMFGSVGAWLYKALAGINMEPGSTGFERILFEPRMVRDLRHASGTVRTERGDVGCRWSRTEGSVSVEVTIPVGSTAEIVIPKFNLRNVRVTEGGQSIFENGSFIEGVAGITGAQDKDGTIRITAGSGRYAFVLEGD
jgi:alpha-L-rhamnosidase